MGWFFEQRTKRSEKNGLITATRSFGSWTVVVDGCQQTGPAVHAMWVDAFKKVKQYFPQKKINRVLALGLGAGGEIATIARAFPGSTLTVIEYDPEMVLLAKELALHKPFPFPSVIVNDAKDELPKLSGFDLLIVDIFKGEHPSPLITDPAFLRSLANALAEGGLMVANVYKRPEYLSAPASSLTLILTWKFRWNHLGLFQKV